MQQLRHTWLSAGSGLWPLLLLQLCTFLCPSIATADPLMVSIEVRYLAPAAGEVELVWGVNGWQTLAEAYRPNGTHIQNKVMSIRMTRLEKEFIATVPALKDGTMEFGFLTTQTAGGAPIQSWDGDHHILASGAQTLSLVPKSTYHYAGLLMDPGGIIGVSVLGIEMSVFALLALRSMIRFKQPYEIRSFKPNFQFALISAGIAGLAGFYVISHHEMWRDELQAWSIAAGSTSLRELLANSRHEGHPAVWYIALYEISRWFHDPLAMQLFHLAIGTASIFVLCSYSPFRLWQRLCLAFGYFMFFEYYVISRNYALGILALWAFCALRAHSPGRVLLSALILGLLANTSAFGAIIAAGLGLLLLFEILQKEGQRTRNSVLLAAILCVAFFLANLHSSPSADNSPKVKAWNTALLSPYVERTLGSVWASYVPIPRAVPNFWNTNVLDRLSPLKIGSTLIESRDVAAGLAYVLIGASALVFVRRPPILLMYVCTATMLLAFLHTKANHGIRHTGHLFLFFVTCVWLSQATRGPNAEAPIRSWGQLFISIILTIQFMAGVLCSITDSTYPFSASKETADFIKRNNLQSRRLVGSKYNVVSSVAGYLNQPVFYLDNGQTGTYTDWSKPRTKLSPLEIVQKAKDIHASSKDDILLISSYDLGNSDLALQKIASFEQSIIEDERYWLYLLPSH